MDRLLGSSSPAPWYIYSLAGGSVFFWGTGILALAVLVLATGSRWPRRILGVILTVVAIAMIAISAAAIPFLLYVIWAGTIPAWLVTPTWNHPRRTTAMKAIVLLITGAAGLLELSYTLRPSPPSGSFPRLYVIGDSISAGLGPEYGKTWPVLIASAHHVNVIDLSQAGATIAVARKRLEHTPLADGLVFLEIGGNDMLGKGDPARFASDLDSLVTAAEGPGRKLVMLELPLLPFDNAYGVAQRRISRRHGIMLIPRRFMVDVLQTPNATVDGIHLSATGQQLLADEIWSLIGGSLQNGAGAGARVAGVQHRISQ